MTLYADIKTWGWMVDLSSDDGPTIDIPGMIAAGCGCFMFRASSGQQLVKGSAADIANYVDPQFANYVEQAKGVPVIAYHYFVPGVTQSPTSDSDYQFQALVYALKNKAVNGICLDLEEMKQVDTNTNTMVKVQTFVGWINKAYPNCPVFFYSSSGWLAEYPALSNWLSYPGASRLLIMAQWITDPANGFITVTPAEIPNYLPDPTVDYKVITPGYATWQAWQCRADLSLGGHQIDLSVWHYPQAQLDTLLSFNQPAPVTPPVVVPPVATTTSQFTDDEVIKINKVMGYFN